MGHANLSNLSTFFVNRLYAKGSLSLKEACEQAHKSGETLHASEGEYEDPYELGLGFMDIIHYLTMENPQRHHYSGPNGGGPWIAADLSPWQGKKKTLSFTTKKLLVKCEENPNDRTIHSVASDSLREDGQEEWAWYVQHLPLLRKAYSQFLNDEDEYHEENMPGQDGWLIFDNIKWRFAPGVRKNYKEVPRLSNVTH